MIDPAVEHQIAEACRLIIWRLEQESGERQAFLDRVALEILSATVAHEGPVGPDIDATASDELLKSRPGMRVHECRVAYDYAEALWAERQERIAKQAKESV